MFAQPPFRHEKQQRGQIDWKRTSARLELMAYSMAVNEWSEKFMEELGKLLEPTMKALAEFAVKYQAIQRDSPRQD